MLISPDALEQHDGPTCGLDVADAGESTLEDVAKLLSVGRERVRQIQDRATRKLRRHFPDLAAFLEERDLDYPEEP